MDFDSKLLGDGGGQKFFANCLLFLSPEQLKACRLVNTVWDQFIMDEVWGKRRGMRRLEEKLVHRWKTAEPITVELGQARERVCSMFCNDAHVFCGQGNGIVAVYSQISGEWVRDLTPGEVGTGFNHTRVFGSKEVIAAAVQDSGVTVWSSHREMEQLYHFNANDRNCLDLACEHGEDKSIVDFKVVGSKIALLVVDFENNKTSLVVLKRGEHIWEEKTLACFPSNPTSRLSSLAIDGDWVAVAKWSIWDHTKRLKMDSTKVMLWQDDTFRQDLDLPGCLPAAVMDIAMKLPFLIFSLRDIVTGCASIKVFRLAADSGMEDINTVASLFKSIPLADNLMPIRRGIICNELFFGFVLDSYAEERLAVILTEKKALLDPAVPPLETERRQINLDGPTRRVDMNTTSLVFGQDQRLGSGETGTLLLRNDFWMPSNNML